MERLYNIYSYVSSYHSVKVCTQYHAWSLKSGPHNFLQAFRMEEIFSVLKYVILILMVSNKLQYYPIHLSSCWNVSRYSRNIFFKDFCISSSSLLRLYQARSHLNVRNSWKCNCFMRDMCNILFVTLKRHLLIFRWSLTHGRKSLTTEIFLVPPVSI